jgi:hypothetical protein
MATGYSSAAVIMGHLALKRTIRHAEANDLVGRNVAALADTPKGQEGRPSKSLTGRLSEGPRLPRQPSPAAGRCGVDPGPDESNRGCPGSVTAHAVNPVVSAAECLNRLGNCRSG